MNTDNAAKLTDEFIRLILQNQENLFPSDPPLRNTDNAIRAAQTLAAFRQELLNLLAQQS